MTKHAATVSAQQPGYQLAFQEAGVAPGMMEMADYDADEIYLRSEVRRRSLAEADEGRLGRRRRERRAGLAAHEQEQRATGRRLPTTHYLGRLFVSSQRPRAVTVSQSEADLNPYAADL